MVQPIYDIIKIQKSKSLKMYWRDSKHEVDFVIERGKRLTAIEVKSGPASGHADGLNVFAENFGKCRKLLVGEGGIPIAEFLSYPAEHWL